MSTIFAFYVAIFNNSAIIRYMGIYDIIFIVIVLLALFIGLKKGIAGVLLGFLGTLIIGVALGFGVNALTPTLIYEDAEVGLVQTDDTLGYSSSFYSIYQTVNDAVTATNADLFNCELVRGEDDTLYVKGIFEEGGTEELKKFSELIMSSFGSNNGNTDENGETSEAGEIEEGAENGETGITDVATSVVPLEVIDNMIDTYGSEGMTVGNAVSAFMTQIIFGAVIWLIAFIVLIIIKAIIRHCVFKFLDNHSAMSKIDRAIGAIVSVVVIVMIAWLAVSVVGQNAGDWGIGEAYNSAMESNPILGFFNSNSLFGENIPSPETPIPEEGSSEMAIRLLDILNPLK